MFEWLELYTMMSEKILERIHTFIYWTSTSICQTDTRVCLQKVTLGCAQIYPTRRLTRPAVCMRPESLTVFQSQLPMLLIRRRCLSTLKYMLTWGSNFYDNLPNHPDALIISSHYYTLAVASVAESVTVNRRPLESKPHSDWMKLTNGNTLCKRTKFFALVIRYGPRRVFRPRGVDPNKIGNSIQNQNVSVPG